MAESVEKIKEDFKNAVKAVYAALKLTKDQNNNTIPTD